MVHFNPPAKPKAGGKQELNAKSHWENPFRMAHAGSKATQEAGMFWKQPRRWLHIDSEGAKSYVTVRENSIKFQCAPGLQAFIFTH